MRRLKKAISPLVAAVLLIAVTMTIAGMLAYWASSFVRQQTETFQNQTIAGECNFADFRVYLCSYNSTTQSISLILNNVANVELRNLTAQIIYANNTIDNKPLTGSLPANILKSFSISGVSPDYSSLTIRTHCPQLSVSSACR